MKNENDKKGFFKSFIGGKKATKGSCCGSFELEELSDESKNKDRSASIIGNKNVRKGSCCCNFQLEEIPDESETDKDEKA